MSSLLDFPNHPAVLSLTQLAMVSIGGKVSDSNMFGIRSTLEIQINAPIRNPQTLMFFSFSWTTLARVSSYFVRVVDGWNNMGA